MLPLDVHFEATLFLVFRATMRADKNLFRLFGERLNFFRGRLHFFVLNTVCYRLFGERLDFFRGRLHFFVLNTVCYRLFGERLDFSRLSLVFPAISTVIGNEAVKNELFNSIFLHPYHN